MKRGFVAFRCALLFAAVSITWQQEARQFQRGLICCVLSQQPMMQELPQRRQDECLPPQDQTVCKWPRQSDYIEQCEYPQPEYPPTDFPADFTTEQKAPRFDPGEEQKLYDRYPQNLQYPDKYSELDFDTLPRPAPQQWKGSHQDTDYPQKYKTSKGNYLRDLSCGLMNIDFNEQPHQGFPSSSQDYTSPTSGCFPYYNPGADPFKDGLYYYPPSEPSSPSNGMFHNPYCGAKLPPFGRPENKNPLFPPKAFRSVRNELADANFWLRPQPNSFPIQRSYLDPTKWAVAKKESNFPMHLPYLRSAQSPSEPSAFSPKVLLSCISMYDPSDLLNQTCLQSTASNNTKNENSSEDKKDS